MAPRWHLKIRRAPVKREAEVTDHALNATAPNFCWSRMNLTKP